MNDCRDYIRPLKRLTLGLYVVIAITSAIVERSWTDVRAIVGTESIITLAPVPVIWTAAIIVIADSVEICAVEVDACVDSICRRIV